TQDAFLFQDPDFDMVQLRAFGDFRYRIKDPETFINQFVGTFGAATSADVEDRIKDEIVKQLNVTLGKMKANGLKVVDFAMSLNDIEQGTLANSKPHFVALGVELVQISGLNIPLPESIKEALEKMASAKVLGRTNAAAYQQFALADSMKAAAANPSGGAGTGIGLGAGIGLGYGKRVQSRAHGAHHGGPSRRARCPEAVDDRHVRDGGDFGHRPGGDLCLHPLRRGAPHRRTPLVDRSVFDDLRARLLLPVCVDPRPEDCAPARGRLLRHRGGKLLRFDLHGQLDR